MGSDGVVDLYHALTFVDILSTDLDSQSKQMRDTFSVSGVSGFSLLITRLLLEFAVTEVEKGACQFKHANVLFGCESKNLNSVTGQSVLLVVVHSVNVCDTVGQVEVLGSFSCW